jgi:hypothetical protein
MHPVADEHSEPPMTIIYRKTAKGQAEIETRTHRLPPRQRGALILVDGQRSAVDLAKLIPGDVEATLQQLLADGFIDVFAVLADRPALPSAAPAAPPTTPIDQMKREAVRALTQQLGPMAETVALKIAHSQSLAELRPLLTLGAQMLRDVKGPEVADAFASHFLAVDVLT